jgi:hypothetical protein
VWAESLRGLLCGVCFGVTSPLVSHPLDVIKSRMQALPSAQGSSLSTLASTLRSGGIRALYAGLLPPLIGSAFYRSLQMSVFSAAYAALAPFPELTAPVPQLAGLQLRVLVAGAAATTARALLETPLEVLKVRRQLQVSGPRLTAKELFVGFSLTWSRLYIALGGFFAAVDHCDRHYPALFQQPGGSFLKGAVCATACWWLAWPLEVAKNRVQSGLHAGGVRAVLSSIVKERGLSGLYRGIGPGTLRSLVGNGFALLAFDTCKEALR